MMRIFKEFQINLGKIEEIDQDYKDGIKKTRRNSKT